MYLSQAQLERYQSAIRKMTSWLYSHWDQLVSEGDPQAHYKGPAAWTAIGDPHTAGMHRKIIVERFLQNDGDFRMSADCKGWKAFPASPQHRYVYSNGWIISGMLRSGAYDIARRGLEFVCKMQDPRTGGFFSCFDPRTGTIGKAAVDSSSTSSAGMALVAAGRLDEARRAGDFILRLLEAQPKPNEYYYASMKADGTLETEFGNSQDQWDLAGRKQKCLSAVDDAAGEMTWLIGKPNKFLTRLYTATGEEKYLQGARRTVEFFLKLHPNAWVNPASCKTMWGSAEIFRITGETRYAEIATRLLDQYCGTQLPSGCWLHTLWYKNEQEQPFVWTSDMVFESCVEYSDVLYDLGSR